MKTRVGRASAALALLTIALTGCGEEGDRFLSNAQTCAQLAKVAAGNLDEIRQNTGSPEKLERAARDAAAELEAEAAELDSAKAQKAVDELVASMRRIAERAEQGQNIDLADVSDANKALADACT